MELLISISKHLYNNIMDCNYTILGRQSYKGIILGALNSIKNGRTTQWNPVKERMPEVSGYYLIQYSREICADEMAVAYYSVEEKESNPDYDWEFKACCGEYKEVIAWRELPEFFYHANPHDDKVNRGN